MASSTLTYSREPAHPYSRRTLHVSLAANVVLLLGIAATAGSIVQSRGGIAYLRSLASGGAEIAGVEPSFRCRSELFRRFSVAPGGIVFLGDSLTSGCEWAELLKRRDVYNRGIGGDVSTGVLQRLDSVIAMRPRKVFLLIGTNDGQIAGLTPEQTAANIHAIAQRLRAAGIAVVVQSLLPSRSQKKNDFVREVNAQLRTDPFFLNLHGRFVGEDGMIQPRYTVDGLHLSADGYDVWRSAVLPLIG